MNAVDLTPDTVDAIARRVVELLDVDRSEPQGLVDAADAAARLGVSRDYVYGHADELGAIRLGSGERGRLRFDPERLAAWTPPTRPTRATARARRHSPGVQLLPVKDAA